MVQCRDCYHYTIFKFWDGNYYYCTRENKPVENPKEERECDMYHPKWGRKK